MNLSTLIPIAHAGHWILYVIPILVVLIAVTVSAIRERRARKPLLEGDE